MSRIIKILLIFHLSVAINVTAGSVSICFSKDHVGVKSNKVSCCGEQEVFFSGDQLSAWQPLSEKCFDINISFPHSLNHLIKSRQIRRVRLPEWSPPENWIVSSYRLKIPELSEIPLNPSDIVNSVSTISLLNTVKLRL